MWLSVPDSSMARVGEQLEVVRQRGLADVDLGGERSGGKLTFALETTQDLSSQRVGEGFEGAVHGDHQLI